MNSKLIGSTVLALCVTACGSAFAQNDHRDNGHDRPSAHDFRNNDHGRNVHEAPPPHRMPAREHEDRRGRGAGPSHNFYKGGRLPPEYRNRQYVINDWRGHHLSPPPRGYYWVQTGGDFVLAAIATGLIAQIILNN